MFKVGDYIKGKIGSFREYGITNEHMILGVVTDVYGDDNSGNDNMDVYVLKHEEDHAGTSFPVHSKYFIKVNERDDGNEDF